MKKVGIFAGTFDPVHQGHLAFALAAAEVAGLNKVIFLPEAKPRQKEAKDLKHRLAMVEAAVKNFKKLDVLKLNDEQFTVARTLPKLEKQLGGAELFLLVGSDVFKDLPSWPNAKTLLRKVKIIVGHKGSNELEKSKLAAHVIYTNFKDVSSTDVRSRLAKDKEPHFLMPATNIYIKEKKLY